jgi:hypothetical protein
MKKLLIVLVMLISTVAVQAQEKYTVSGYVKDGETGEELLNATVLVKEISKGVVTNLYGFYSLTLPKGNYTLVYSFVGYESMTKTIDLTADVRIDMEVVTTSEKLEDFVITDKAKNENVESIEMSTVNMKMETIKKIPAFMGEVDIIKAIQMLPGVQTVGEGGSGFYVRGGGVDQNLIMLDEATVYNASHLMGFFSVFNPDVIKDLQLYKGGIPAEYGGRLSSVLDIRMKDGNSKKFSATGGVGTISSRLTLEAPIKKDVGSFIVAGRRTYADIFLNFAKDTNIQKSKLYFYDLNAKANYKLNDNNRVYLSGYFGRDVFGFSDLFDMNWGNSTATLRWNHVYNNKLFSNLTLLYSNFDYHLGSNQGSEAFSWESNIKDYTAKLDYDYFANLNNTVKFGVHSTYHKFDPGIIKGEGDESIFNELKMPATNAIESAGYISNEQKFGKKFSAIYGLRYSLFQNIGKSTVYTFDDQYVLQDTLNYDKGEIYQTYGGLEPRLGMKLSLDSVSSIKASYNRTRQYVHLASNSTSASPLDIWFPSSPNVKPQTADQVALGYFRNFKDNAYEASVELYYKKMDNAIDFKDHAQLLLNPYLEGELRFGDAYAYGAEFLVKKQEGRFTGWISYTLARTEKEISAINNGNRYPAKYDKTHDIAIIGSYDLSDRVSLSANWIFATGSAVTMPTGRFEYFGTVVPVYSDRNAERLPSYHRLDLAVTVKGKKKKEDQRLTGDWVFSVYNAYNRHNAFSINFKESPDNPAVTIAEKTYLFGIIPAITYNFKF